ncbi:MAG TPA: hypothetical protein DDZ51_00850 [Planctomycetaceae bacterium]|nr:hypothetical protein [Planctomycetaceae bacterium]
MATFFVAQMGSQWPSVTVFGNSKVIHVRCVLAVALTKNVAKFFWLRKPRVKRVNWWVKCSSF